jgi:uncharacterized protein (TIGR00297 family)
MWLDLLGGVLVATPFSLAAWRFRAVTGGGAVAGFCCAVSIYLGAFLAGIAVLGTALALTVLSSRIGWRRKARLGISQDDEGKRGAPNVLANCGIAAAVALLSALSSDWTGELGAVLLVTAVAAGASDTVASEIGKAFGRRPRSFPTLRPVAAGTPGAVTLVGTVAGAVSAVIIAWPSVVLWLLHAERVPVIALACTAGAFVESTLATLLERRDIVGNNTLNLLNTATATAVAAAWLQ